MIIFSIILIALGGIHAYRSTLEEDLDLNKGTKKEEVKEEFFTKNKVEIDKDSDEAKLFNILNEYGTKMYDSKEYEKFTTKNNMYFISLNSLEEKYGYDISSFKGPDGTVCNREESGIYFDINNTLKLDLSNGFKPVLPTLIGCNFNTKETNGDQ